MTSRCNYCELDGDGDHETDCPNNPANMAQEAEKNQAALAQLTAYIAELKALLASAKWELTYHDPAEFDEPDLFKRIDAALARKEAG